MLEEVRIDLFVVRCEVRLDVVVELDDLELDAFLFELGLDRLENLGMGNGGCADLDDFLRLGGRIVRAAAAADEGKRCEGENECK